MAGKHLRKGSETKTGAELKTSGSRAETPCRIQVAAWAGEHSANTRAKILVKTSKGKKIPPFDKFIVLPEIMFDFLMHHD